MNTFYTRNGVLLYTNKFSDNAKSGNRSPLLLLLLYLPMSSVERTSKRAMSCYSSIKIFTEKYRYIKCENEISNKEKINKKLQNMYTNQRGYKNQIIIYFIH